MNVERLACAVKLVIGELDDAYPWRRDALCREHPEVNFFPARGESPEPACAICARCLVSTECAAFVETLGVRESGVWAGSSGRSRRQTRTKPVAA